MNSIAFKAQATLIKKALNNAGLNKPEITIGTVHSLQGAERQLISFSPVYTKADSGTRLFFNQSANMLNVAVSRAKENFIIMGDMNLIAAVAHDTPYGQLFGRLEVRGNESPYFSLNDLPDHVRPNCWLAGTEQHDDFLRSLFQKSRRRLVISSPWIVEKVIEAFKNDIYSSVEGGVAIHVITDADNNLEPKGQRGIQLLKSLGAHVHQVPKFHTKQLFCDDVLCADGSFNWLSASRSTTYQKVERTFVQASTECGDILKSLCEQCQLQI